MRPGIKERLYAKFAEYCKHREDFQVKELVACNHPKNHQGCSARTCPFLKELEVWSKTARLGWW